MTYYVKALIVLAVLAFGFGGGWKTRDWKAGADDAQRLELEARDAHRRSDQNIAAATAYEADKATQRVKTITITREVARAVQADPDCSQRALPAGLRESLTRAAAGGDQPFAIGPMPAASAARTYDLGRPRDGLLRGLGGTGRLSSAAEAPR